MCGVLPDRQPQILSFLLPPPCLSCLAANRLTAGTKRFRLIRRRLASWPCSLNYRQLDDGLHEIFIFWWVKLANSSLVHASSLLKQVLWKGVEAYLPVS
jgi:hypothetical protein